MTTFIKHFAAYRLDEILGDWKPYAEVVHNAVERTCKRNGIAFRPEDAQRIYEEVPTWGPHPDVPAGLAEVAREIPLVILSNAMNSQIMSNVEKLGAPFHAVFTAEQVGSYKPRILFDGGVACDCPECRKEGASNLLMVLMRELIERLQKSRPDVQVETVGGYGAVPDPPSNTGDHFSEAASRVGAVGADHGIGYDDPKYDRRNLDNWRKAAKGGLTICQYYTDNFAEPWVMGPFTKAMESDRRYFLKHKVDAVYMLMYSPGYWWNHSLNGYIAGRCFYDVSLSPRDEIADYATNYFGPKAGPLLAKYYKEWADNIELSYRVRGEARNQDRQMLARERKELIRPGDGRGAKWKRG